MLELIKAVDEPAAVDGGKLITKREICRLALGWKRAVEASSARRLLVFSEDSLDALAACLGAWSSGVPTVLLPEASVRFARAMLEDGLILEGDFCALQAAGFGGLPAIEPFSAAPEEAQDIAADEESDLIILFTSGSTGRAKLVPKRLEQMKAEADAASSLLAEFFPKDELVEVASTATHQHMYGLSFRLFAPLFIPNALLTSRRLHLPEDVVNGIRQAASAGRRAFLVTTPTHLERISGYADAFTAEARPSGVLSATAPLSEAAAAAARGMFGVDPMEILGSTETGAMAYRRRAGGSGEKWRPFPGMKICVESESGVRSTHGRGRLVLEGPQIRSGIETTSDLADLASGEFALSGRADRIIKIEGKRFSLNRIESALIDLGAQRARALLIKNRSGRSELCCVLVPGGKLASEVLRTGKTSWVKSAKKQLAQTLSSLEIPRRYRLAARLPSEESGAQKVTASSLSKLFDDTRPDWVPVLDQTADGVRTVKARAVLSPSLAWFRGHFDSLPILPGVAQLLLAERLFKEHAPTPRSPSRIKNLKFKSPIKPGTVVELAVSFPADAEASDSTPLSFEWSSVKDGEKISHSSGKIILEDWSRR